MMKSPVDHSPIVCVFPVRDEGMPAPLYAVVFCCRAQQWSDSSVEMIPGSQDALISDSLYVRV